VVEPPASAPVHIRPLRPADGPRACTVFRGLGPTSRYRRYGRLAVAEADASSWVAELDGVDRFGVEAAHASTDEPLGVACYVRSGADPAEAEIAVSVIDAWQRQGVGTALAHALIEHARACGIARLSATILPDNLAARRLMRRLGARRRRDQAGTLEMDIAIAGGRACVPCGDGRAAGRCG